MLNNIKITTEQLGFMKHAIGFRNDKVKGRIHRRYNAFRNYFTTSKGSSNLEKLTELSDLKLMRKRVDPWDDEGFVFHVTDFGFEYLQMILDVSITEED